MNFRAILLYILFTGFVVQHLQAQQYNTQRLSIGDKVPDVALNHILNYPSGAASLSDFKGKLVIIDFWATWCGTCIAAMPEMERLQARFKDQVQVLLVTKEKEEAVQRLKAKSKNVRETTLPLVVADSTLSNLFPYLAVPYHVWVDGYGIVRQMTNGYNTTAENISKLLTGKELKLAVRREQPDFDRAAPLWLEGNGRQLKHLQYYSFIMNRIDGYGGNGRGIEIDSATGKIVRVYAYNNSILQLFQYAFNGHGDHTFERDNRAILEVKNPERYRWPARNHPGRDQWMDSSLYAYDLKVPESKSDQVFEIMKQDLERFFNLQGRIEKRMVKCLVLKRIGLDDHLKSEGGASLFKCKNEECTGTIIRNKPVASLINAMININHFLPVPIVDGTGYNGNIDMDINASLKDLPVLNKELSRYGLAFQEEKREIDMLIIKEYRYAGTGQ